MSRARRFCVAVFAWLGSNSMLTPDGRQVCDGKYRNASVPLMLLTL